MTKGKFEVIPGDFGGDPEVEDAFKEALRRMFKATKGKMRAFAVVVVEKDGNVGTAYEIGGELYALLGGISVLKHKIIDGVVEEEDEEE